MPRGHNHWCTDPSGQSFQATITDTTTQSSELLTLFIINPDYKQERSHDLRSQWVAVTSNPIHSFIQQVIIKQTLTMCFWSPGILSDQLGKVPALDVTI